MSESLAAVHRSVLGVGEGGGGCQLVGPDTKLEGQAPSIKWKGGGGGRQFFLQEDNFC